VLPTLGLDFFIKSFRDVGIPEIHFWEKIVYYEIWWLDISPLNILEKGVNFAFLLTPDLPFCMRGYDVNKKTLKYFDELDSVLQSLVKCYRVQQHCMNFCKNVYKQSILYDWKKDMPPSNDFQVLTRVFKMTIMYLEKYFEVWIDLVKAEVVFFVENQWLKYSWWKVRILYFPNSPIYCNIVWFLHSNFLSTIIWLLSETINWRSIFILLQRIYWVW